MASRKSKAEGRRKGSPPRGRPPAAGGDGRKRGERQRFRWFSYEVKRKAVRLYLEEGMPAEIVAREIGSSKGIIFEWVRDYRLNGEEGLKPKGYGLVNRRVNLTPALKAKITGIKKNNPTFGVRRISQVLRRMLMLPASHETVRRTLHREKLIAPPKKKAQKNPQKPRFFERSTPNQMWQSDIFCFRLGGENAYLLGFIDDYSRYIAGLGVYRSQTADNLLEVYRRARGEYGAPREMLTDNGRQYTNWRGKTAFEKEMAKDRIHHFRSSPHHPQTLGKIERFWKSIWEEFLSRARFDSFESAQERIAYWVKYYNHKRPHQGIAGLCPADRFFEIRKEIKEVIERGVESNVQELALRGKPAEQFYMVGRLGEKSVVIRAERGQVSMQVEGDEEKLIGGIGNDDTGEGNKAAEEGVQRAGEGAGSAVGMERATEACGSVQEPWDSMGPAEQLGEECPGRNTEGAGTGDASRGNDGVIVGDTAGEIAGSAGKDGVQRGVSHEETQCDGEMPSGAERMGREAETVGRGAGNGGKHEPALPVAGNGNGRYAAGSGAEMAGRVALPGPDAETEETAGPEGRGTGGAAAEAGEAVVAACGSGEADNLTIMGGADGREAVGGKDRPGAERATDRDGGGTATWGEPQDVLQAGEPGALGSDGGCAGSGERATGNDSGRGKGCTETADRRSGEGSAGSSADASDPGGAGPTVGRRTTEEAA